MVGGVAGVAIIVGLVWFFLRRQRKKNAAADAATTTATSEPNTALSSPVPAQGNGFSDPKPPPEHNLSENFAPQQIHGEGQGGRHQRTASELDPAGLVELSSPEAEAVAASRAQCSATTSSISPGGSSPGSWWKPDGSVGGNGLGFGSENGQGYGNLPR